ncbi:hypothetical protein EYC84_006827 [Monilinia fructicola]|uniref:Uncharacterized protein n=1 Tax=Monilinia fructicola TaxID=38448 RepID=A0A5M9K940_MONFR|nr:hypothetical protein EYC84_006827 [Monilinia fructicola]
MKYYSIVQKSAGHMSCCTRRGDSFVMIDWFDALMIRGTYCTVLYCNVMYLIDSASSKQKPELLGCLLELESYPLSNTD